MTDTYLHPTPITQLPAHDSVFKVQLDVFEGPLYLLLKLIEQKQLDISRVALAEVAEGFLLYLEAHPDMPAGPLAQFVWIASKLLLIKSQALLPQTPLAITEGEEDPGDELIRRLEAYKRLQEAANWLRSREAEGLRSYERPAAFGLVERAASTQEIGTSLEGVALTRLVSMVQKRMQLTLSTPPTASIVTRGYRVTVAEKVIQLRKQLNALKADERLPLGQQFVHAASCSRTELVVLFMAVLEIIRRKHGLAEQEQPFGEIWLRRALDDRQLDNG